MEQVVRNKESGFIDLEIPLSAFNQSKTSEISYQGKMYDIKSYTIKGNTVYLKVVNDTEEDHINTQIKRLAQNNDTDQDNLIQHLLDLLTQLYICPVSEPFIALIDVREVKHTSFHPRLISHQPDIVSPPPKA